MCLCLFGWVFCGSSVQLQFGAQSSPTPAAPLRFPFKCMKLLIFHFPFSCNLTLAKWRHKFSIDFLPLSQFNTFFFPYTNRAFYYTYFFFCASPTTVALVRRLDFLAFYNRGRYSGIRLLASVRYNIDGVLWPRTRYIFRIYRVIHIYYGYVFVFRSFPFWCYISIFVTSSENQSSSYRADAINQLVDQYIRMSIGWYYSYYNILYTYCFIPNEYTFIWIQRISYFILIYITLNKV